MRISPAFRKAALQGRLSRSVRSVKAEEGTTQVFAGNLAVSQASGKPFSQQDLDAISLVLRNEGIRQPCFAVEDQLHWRTEPSLDSSLEASWRRSHALASIRSVILGGASVRTSTLSDSPAAFHRFPKGPAKVLWPSSLELGWPAVQDISDPRLERAEVHPARLWWEELAHDLTTLAKRRGRSSKGKRGIPLSPSFLRLCAIALAWSIPEAPSASGKPQGRAFIWQRRVALLAADAGMESAVSVSDVGRALAEGRSLPGISRKEALRILSISERQASELPCASLCASSLRSARKKSGLGQGQEWIGRSSSSRQDKCRAALAFLSRFPDAPLPEIARVGGFSVRSLMNQLKEDGSPLSLLRRQARVHSAVRLRKAYPRMTLDELSAISGWSPNKISRLLS